jgi:hypothetical protein
VTDYIHICQIVQLLSNPTASEPIWLNSTHYGAALKISLTTLQNLGDQQFGTFAKLNWKKLSKTWKQHAIEMTHKQFNWHNSSHSQALLPPSWLQCLGQANSNPIITQPLTTPVSIHSICNTR